MKLLVKDTIAAVSTPRGKGGVAMIRISGTDALPLAEKVFFPKNGKKLSECTARTALYGEIREKNENGESAAIDDGVAVIYRAPHSFTGEDTVEICCHGGVLLTEKVLEACFTAGCRPAEAGEFTKRAFIAGKMTLSQAESLGNLLEAKTEAQLMLSRGGMNGRLATEIGEIYEGLKNILASVYAKIDFPDEDLASMSADEVKSAAENIKARLKKLASTYRAGRAVREGIRTVICGAANAGKSSIYNRIVGREAAIVTDVEGTTRDVLEQTAALGRVTLLLCDTAGLRETNDKVEMIGIDRTKNAILTAELVLAVFDLTRGITAEDKALVAELAKSGACKVAVLNKCDKKTADEGVPSEISENFENVVTVSALTGEGFDDLVRKVEELFDCGKTNLLSDAVIWDARRYSAVVRSTGCLEKACEALEIGLPFDLASSDLEEAMELLGELDGRGVSEDIVTEIFSHFCVGK